MCTRASAGRQESTKGITSHCQVQSRDSGRGKTVTWECLHHRKSQHYRSGLILTKRWLLNTGHCYAQVRGHLNRSCRWRLSSLLETYVPGLCPLLIFFFSIGSGFASKVQLWEREMTVRQVLGALNHSLTPCPHAQTEAYITTIKSNEQGQKPEQVQHCINGNPHTPI